ncbi:META domain-containing protein [Brevibacterium album]|uniref:META domain-containing protein n=1 Tax=Brevibacterium album TaxID=417948 RepID=UPI000687B549|nr:META domain-containing protein [Brevibacterium album]
MTRLSLKRAPLLLAVAAAAAALAGCGGGTVSPAETGEGPRFEGKWVAEDPEGAFLEFAEPDEEGTGHVSGSDGCNGLQGEFTIDGDTAVIERGFGTLKGCPGTDTWMADTASVVVSGDELSVLDGEGEEIGTLSRES